MRGAGGRGPGARIRPNSVCDGDFGRRADRYSSGRVRDRVKVLIPPPPGRRSRPSGRASAGRFAGCSRFSPATAGAGAPPSSRPGSCSCSPIGTRAASARASRHCASATPPDPAWAFPSRVYADGVSLRPRPGAPPRLPRAPPRGARLPRRCARRRRPPGTYAWRDDGVEIFLRGFLEAADPEGRGGPERVRVVLEDDRVAGVARMTAPPAHVAARHARARHSCIRRGSSRGPSPCSPSRTARAARGCRWRASRASLRDAVIASEDRRFRSHFGLDLTRQRARARWSTCAPARCARARSTITQQLARGLFLGRERTFARKFKEVVLRRCCSRLFLSKDQILEMYLNSVYWGQGDTRAASRASTRRRAGTSRRPGRFAHARARPRCSRASSRRRTRTRRFAGPSSRSRAATRCWPTWPRSGLIDARTAARARALPLWVRRGTTRVERFPDVHERGRRRPRPRPARGRAAGAGGSRS